MDFKTFRTEFAKAHKGEPSPVQSAYDIAKAAAPTATYLQWQAAAWNKLKRFTGEAGMTSCLPSSLAPKRKNNF